MPFGGAGALEGLLAEGRRRAAFFGSRREFARRRLAIIAASPEPRERRRIGPAVPASALAAALRPRRVGEPAATLGPEAGVAAFKVASERRVEEGNRTDLPRLPAPQGVTRGGDEPFPA